MTKYVFDPKDFECRGSLKRLSTFNLTDHDIKDNEWVKMVTTFLPYHILANNVPPHADKNRITYIADSYRGWIKENCQGWWTDSNTVSGILLLDNEVIKQYKNRVLMPALLGMMNPKAYYCFENRDDAIMFRLYVNG